MKKSVIALALGAAGAALWARSDYRAWTALGKGGLPHTLRGWARMSRLRLQKGETIGTTALDPEVGAVGDGAYLGALIQRCGPRPKVAPHPIPQRQLNQFTTTAIRRRLDAVFDEAVRARPQLLRFETSFFEKHGPAVTLRAPERGHRWAAATHGEIGHIHQGDGSMHLILSASDAKAAIEAGWGERHPLAGSLGLPITYLYVYPPRDEVELGTVRRLLNAAIEHMGGPGLPAAERGASPAA